MDRLRVDASDLEAIGDIRRAAHTLKGAAGAVGSPAISNLAYRLETLLNLLLEQELGATEVQVNLCLEAGDLLSDMLVMEVDFDELAKHLQTVSIGFDEQIELVTLNETEERAAADSDVEEDSSIAAENEKGEKDEAVAEPAETKVAAELSEAEIQEIREQLTSGMTMPEELVEIFAEEAEDHLRRHVRWFAKTTKRPFGQ